MNSAKPEATWRNMALVSHLWRRCVLIHCHPRGQIWKRVGGRGTILSQHRGGSPSKLRTGGMAGWWSHGLLSALRCPSEADDCLVGGCFYRCPVWVMNLMVSEVPPVLGGGIIPGGCHSFGFKGSDGNGSDCPAAKNVRSLLKNSTGRHAHSQCRAFSVISCGGR